MATLFKQPATDADLRFAMRCLWTLDPNRHLFEGDFRDFARERTVRILSPDSISRDIPESAIDEIEDLLKSCPCSPATRYCWEEISQRMRQNLHKVHVMELWNPEYALWEFIRNSFGYGSGRYWGAGAFPAEFNKARGLFYSEILESVASSFKQHLDPHTVQGALILWMLWCLAILWPAQAGRPFQDYLTPYSLSRQLLEDIEECGASRPLETLSLITKGVDPILADKTLHRRFNWCSLAHALARSGRVELFGLLKSMPIDEKDHQGETPLLTALYWRRWQAARWFLNAGANPGSKSLIGEPALVGALRMGAPSSLFLRFLQKGANPSQVDTMGNSALHAAAAMGCPLAVRAMSAVPVESRNKLGHTPLYSAVFAMVAGKGSRIAVIKTLVASGADPDPTSKKGVRVSDFLQRALKLGTSPQTIRRLRSALQIK